MTPTHSRIDFAFERESALFWVRDVGVRGRVGFDHENSQGSGGRRRQSDAMSFSTRSSRDLNGSLHNTVRCAWSFSFKCTQSTV